MVWVVMVIEISMSTHLRIGGEVAHKPLDLPRRLLTVLQFFLCSLTTPAMAATRQVLQASQSTPWSYENICQNIRKYIACQTIMLKVVICDFSGYEVRLIP